MTADTPDTDWKAAAPASWDADYASLWARFQQASERATKWHACFKDAKAERDAYEDEIIALRTDLDAAIARAEAAEAERDALVIVADAARAFVADTRSGLGFGIASFHKLDDALDALSPELGQSD